MTMNQWQEMTGGQRAWWVAKYIIDGHLVVMIGRQVVLTAGRIAETVLLFATLWITANYVGPEYTAHLGNLATVFTALALFTFTLLPEVILFTAIITTLKHFQDARAGKKGSLWWGILNSIPTLIFLVMTIYTFISFVTSKGDMGTANTGLLAIRCLAGWSYPLIGLIHAGITDKHAPHQQVSTLSGVSTVNSTVNNSVNTSQLSTPTTTPRQLSTKVTSIRGRVGMDAKKNRAIKIATDNPGIGATDLSRQAKISRQYATTVLGELASAQTQTVNA